MTQAKKKTLKQLKEERRAQRNYGLLKVKKGQKMCWLSKHDKHGWSLGLCVGEMPTKWLKNVRFSSREEVERTLEGDIGAVFVYLKADGDPSIQ